MDNTLFVIVLLVNALILGAVIAFAVNIAVVLDESARAPLLGAARRRDPADGLENVPYMKKSPLYFTYAHHSIRGIKNQPS